MFRSVFCSYLQSDPWDFWDILDHWQGESERESDQVTLVVDERVPGTEAEQMIPKLQAGLAGGSRLKNVQTSPVVQPDHLRNVF